MNAFRLLLGIAAGFGGLCLLYALLQMVERIAVLLYAYQGRF